MPNYRVQLKQGRRTITNHIEAKSVADCIAFFQENSTMQVSEVLEVKYIDDTIPSMDDFLYNSIYKGVLQNSQRMSKQIVLNNVKITKSETDIAMSAKIHLEVGGMPIESSITGLFKK